MAGRGTRQKVAEAARKLLADKVGVVTDLAERGGDVATAEAAVVEAQDRLNAARAAYAEQYGRALSVGWSDAELDQLNCPADRGTTAPTGARGRRRNRVPEPAPKPPASLEPTADSAAHVPAAPAPANQPVPVTA